jgi:hypothetical protein
MPFENAQQAHSPGKLRGASISKGNLKAIQRLMIERVPGVRMTMVKRIEKIKEILKTDYEIAMRFHITPARHCSRAGEADGRPSRSQKEIPLQSS